MTETATATVDNQKYRVNLICACQNDAAYGYGSTPMEARRVAEMHFRQHHGAKAKYTQIVVEEAVAHVGGGSHYELFAAGLRYEFTRGLGYELYNLESLGDDYFKRDHATHPFVFETHNPTRALQLCEALRRIVDDRGKNKKMRAAAKDALDFIHKVSRVVW